MFNIHGVQISEELLAVSTICVMSMIVNAYYCCCQLPRSSDALLADAEVEMTPQGLNTATTAAQATRETAERGMQTENADPCDDEEDEALYVDEIRLQMKRRSDAMASARVDKLNFIV